MKTINKTIVIGAAFTAAVILAPAAFARDHHEPDPRPSNGIQLAADIVNLVRAVIEPRPAPVVVTPTTERVVTREVVTTTPGTVIVTETEEIPEYSYILYEDEYIPYFDGWLYYHDIWHWVGEEPRPALPPGWTPPPRHEPEHHKIIVIPGHEHKPAPVVIHEPPRHAPVAVVRREPPRQPQGGKVVVVRADKRAPAGPAPRVAGRKPGR